MIITTHTGILSGTLLLILAPILWLLQAYLAIAFARLVLGQLAADWAGRASQGLAPLTDWAPNHINRLLSSETRSPLRSWVGWAIVIGAALVLRHILVGTLLAASHPVAP